MSKKIFYMQRADVLDSPIKDLEKDFVGLKYIRCEGLETKGKPKNIYQEMYADSDEVRVYIPSVINREATKVTMELVFEGANRRKVFNDFYDYIKLGKFKYWDNLRNKEALLVLNNEVKPSEDLFKGSSPYIEVKFPFLNLYGECKDK